MDKMNNRKPRISPHISSGRDFLWIVSVALIYFTAARLSLWLVFQPEGIAAIWPPSGIFLSAILLSRRNLRPYLVGVLFVTDLIAEMLTGTPFILSIIYALALAGDAVLSAWLLLRFVGAPITFERVRDVIGFLCLSVIFSNALSSLVAAAPSGLLPGTSFWNSWKWWAVSDGIGNFLLTPFILGWAALAKSGFGVLNPKRIIEGTALFLLLLLVSFIAFIHLPANDQYSLLITYLPFPILLWSALRFRLCGLTSALILLAALAVRSVLVGQFAGIPIFDFKLDAVIFVQLYLAIMALPLLFLVAVVSERKQSEKALRKSEEQHRTIIETAMDGFWLADIQGHLLDVNETYCRMSGYSEEELLTLHISDLEAVEKNDDIAARIQKIITQGEDRFETRHRRKDGIIFDVEVSVQYRPADGARLVAFLRDITARKRAEDELRQYGHIVSSAKDMLALTDKNFVYLAANPAYLQMFAKTPDEVIGRTVADVFGEAFFSTVIRPRAEQCLAGDMVRYQYWFEFPVAGRRYMDVAYFPYLGPDAGIRGVVVTARDITEHENLQVQLAQAQKMESVGRLAGGVAHDYNNMLSIIIGYSELALEKVDPDDPLNADLMEILSAAKRSTDITRQLLAFARQQTIAPKVLDLNDTVGNALKMLRRLIGEDIDLAWLPGPGVWPVKIDPSQVDQILANLCVNARDAIAGVGKVTIETGNISFDEAYCANHEGFVPGEYVMLAVSDDGSGMAPETLDKIFEPFYTTKSTGKGTGLGLATVYGIVKQNNGLINVYSEPEKGTTLKIYLSRHTGETVGTHHERTLEIPLSRGETVLLVEDDDSILKLGKRILESLGYAVLSATTPTGAISLAEEHAGEIGLLITDVVMPEMNGRELSEQLQRLYPDIKILFMSGYTANVIAHRGILEEGVCFIAKPFSKKDLAVKVREALGNSETRPDRTPWTT